MNSTTIRYKMLVSALLVSGLGWFGSVNAQTTTVFLCAGEYTQNVNGEMITMWGYGLDMGGTCDASSPGPRIEVMPGDITLTINLRNTLPEATSLIIPGQRQATSMIPVAVGGGAMAPGSRVRSFTHEAAATAGTASYTWGGIANPIKSGTYAYQSGTHPAVQVQMGLYGAAWQDSSIGEAYDGEPYAEQAILLYSEIDPALHAAVAGGSYGVGCMVAPCTTSTVDYAPRYFLVNGEVFNGTNLNYGIGAPGQDTLIRFINMGLKMHAPTINGARFRVLAEDGNAYPDHRDQYSVQLAAGKTKDAIISVPAGAAPGTTRYAVYDRMLNLSNDGAPGAGGMMSYLTVGAIVTLPTAADDSYAATEDTVLDTVVATLDGVLSNDSTTDLGGLTASMVSGTSNGTVVLDPTGSFTYDPDPDFAGIDSFVYAASDSVGSAMATATITVANDNDAPVANGESYSIALGGTLSVAAPGVLANDSDVDGDTLTANVVIDTDPTSNLGADGSLSFTPIAEGTYVLTYTANDPTTGVSNVASVTITVGPAPTNEAPVAVDDFGSVSQGGSILLTLVTNDTDAEDGTVVAASVVIVTDVDPSRGSVFNNGDGTVTFTSENAVVGSNRPPRKGTATFTYTVMDLDGATSNEATVRVNVTK